MIRLAIFAALIASTAHATPWTDTTGNCYSDKCQTTGIPDGPYQPPQPKGDTDRDPEPATTQPGYGMCCTVNGQAFSHADLLSRLFLGVNRAEQRAKAACDAKAVKHECSKLSKWAMGVE